MWNGRSIFKILKFFILLRVLALEIFYSAIEKLLIFRIPRIFDDFDIFFH